MRFLRIALGSLNEVETLILIACDLKFLSEVDHKRVLDLSRDLGVRLRNLTAKIQSDQTIKN
jgi:four helix bundle protein